MIATWMLYGAVVAVLAGLGALALERGARFLGRAGRWCWVGAMVVTLALPIYAWMRPVLPEPALAPAPHAGAAVDLTGHVDVVLPAASAPATRPMDWSVLDRPLAYGWALCSLALLGWFAFGTWRLARMRKSWRWNGDLFVSNDVGPAVIGFVRCQVVVPEWSLALSQEQRDLLLAHEAEHLAAYDSRLLLASAAVLALVPWNPGVWWQFRRLRLAIELDCDQRVLRNRPDAATYGRLLLDVGARTTRALVPVTAFNEPMSSLEHRIRALTALRPRRPVLWATGAALASGIAIFAACEAPRPTGPAQKQSFVIQTKEEQGQISSTFIRDSVRRYFPASVPDSVYVWFVVSPDDHVLRYGTTPRRPLQSVNGRVEGRPDLHIVRSEDASWVIPNFEALKTQTVTILGENAMWPQSPGVYWVTLRDPGKPPTWLPPDVDSLALLPWMREGLQKYWAPLMAEKVGPPVDLWFLANQSHFIIATHAANPRAYAGHGYDMTSVASQFAGVTPSMIQDFTLATTRGWARANIQIVWITLRSRSPSPGEIDLPAQRDTVRVTGVTGPWLWQSEGNQHPLALPSRGAMLEKGMVVVADKYPQYLNQRADPPVTVWVVEGADGRILSTHVSKAYLQIGDAEMAGEEPQYRQFRPGEWMSWLPLSEQRTDVRVVWVHSNRGT